MIEVSGVMFEACESGNLVFTVECFDEASATISIKQVINVARWDEIAPLIRQCLADMKLEGDIK